MTNRDMVVIGGSAGCMAPLRHILRELPADLAATVLVVVHVPPDGTRVHAAICSASAQLKVRVASDGEVLEHGTIYLAVPDRHLLVIDGKLKLGLGPRENLARPAIDPLFRSAALSAGPRTIGVILSGTLNDGASGLASIKRRGGIALVQAPQDAAAREMPLAALEASPVDLITDADELAKAIEQYVGEPPGPAGDDIGRLRLEVEIAAGERIPASEFGDVSAPLTLTCPDCGGVLSEIEDTHPLRFRCQMGHAFSGKALLRKQEQHVDEAMRMALRIIEERASLVEHMGRDATQTGRAGMAETYERRAAEYRQYAHSLREAVLLRMETAESAEQDDEIPAIEVHGHGVSDKRLR